MEEFQKIQKKKSNKGLIIMLVIMIFLLVGCLGYGVYKYLSLDKEYDTLNAKYNDVIKNTDDEKSISKDESSQEVVNSKYEFDLSKISCLNSNKTSCTKELNVRYNNENHKLKIVSSRTNVKEKTIITHQIYIDNSEFYKIDGGWYYHEYLSDLENSNWTFDGYVYIFDGSNLGFVLPAYGVEKMGYDATFISPNGSFIKRINVEMAYTSFGVEGMDDLDSISNLEFDGHMLKVWDLDCNTLEKAIQVGITIENNNVLFQKLKTLNNASGGGQGGCKFDKEKLS